jgi:hypothetical protein
VVDIATLGIVVKSQGVKEAERDLRGLETQSGKAERRAATLGKAWGVALGAVAAGATVAAVGLSKWVRNGIEAERVQSQLAARIKSTGAAAGLAVRDLNKMADALQRATTFDDESIGSAQATLLTFTRVGKENFEAATEAVLNMSTALGTDLNAAALQVGKALNDPVQGLTALSRAGVQFSEAQKDTIKQLVETGRTADAQRVILRELETQMGGSARAARDTLGGALAALRNSFDNLLEGNSGGLRGTREAVEGLNRSLNDPQLKQGVDALAGGLLKAAAAAVQAAGQLGSFLQQYRNFLSSKGFARPNEDTALKDLVTRRAKLVEQLKRQESGGLFGGVDPIGKALGIPDKITSALRQQIAEADALIARQKQLARLGDWQEGRVTRKAGQGIFANVTSDPNASKPAVLDVSTGDVSVPKVKAAAYRELASSVRDAAAAVLDFTNDERALTAASLDMERAKSQALVAFERIRAEMSGPLAVAEFEHIQAMQEIQRLGEEAGVGASAIEAAQERERKAYEGTTEAIREQMKAAENPRVFAAMDNFRRSAVDGLLDFASGAKSAKDAAMDFFDNLAQQLLRASANSLISKLFGQTGSDGGGTPGGGFLSSLFSALLGGAKGFARGGYTGDGGRNEPAGLVHRGEYVVNASMVRRLGGPSGVEQRVNGGAQFVQNVSYTIEGRVSREVESQIAARTGTAVQRAIMRNR